MSYFVVYENKQTGCDDFFEHSSIMTRLGTLFEIFFRDSKETVMPLFMLRMNLYC